MATSISPLGNRVVVEPAEQEQRTASGIVLPETAKEKPQRGTVVAVGPGSRGDEWRAPGDGRQGGRHGAVCQVRRHRDQDRRRNVLILREDDILAVVAE